MPDIRALLNRSFRVGKSALLNYAPFRWSKLLHWQQWLVLFAMGIFVIMLEVRDHSRMWQQHNSGQTIWSDTELLREIILFGIIFPVVGGIILGYMDRVAKERDKVAERVEFRRAVVAQMQEAQNWSELAEIIVKMPGSIVSAERTWLMAQRSNEDKFDLITRWERPGSGQLLPYPLISPVVCECCENAKSHEETKIMTCQHLEADNNNGSHYTRHCLWLSPNGRGKTALLFDLDMDHPLDSAQVEVLNDLSNEMSLIIDNANLQYVEQRQGDIARNERMRIARNLHDTLGQHVSYLRLKLEQLNSAQLSSDLSQHQEDLTKMLMIADEAYEQIRNTLEDLRMAEHRDIEEAIHLYASQAAERAGFSVSVQSSGKVGTLSPRQSRQILYIVREALNNVEKHANAQKVAIHLQWYDDEFKLMAYDNGIGFSPKELNIVDHYGMAIMEERSRSINASLAIESALGEGTKITLCLPLSSSTMPGRDVYGSN